MADPKSRLLCVGIRNCHYRGRGECDFITDGDESGREAILQSDGRNAASVLREASRTIQVIITSHSPELLDNKWFKPDSFRIVGFLDAV